MNKSRRRLRSGFTLVETAIATVILAFVMVNIISSFVNLTHSQVRSLLILRAADYAREGLEVAYNISANTYNNPDSWDLKIRSKALSPDEYYPIFTQLTGEISLASGSEVINGIFHRSLKFYEVCRDPDNASPTYSAIISHSPPCDLDTNVVKVVSTVSINHANSLNDIEIYSYLINPDAI
jgi:type II secretory pathway pseudopilin PulG